MTEELEKLGKIIETDVLILGSGAAGCGAAIKAREKGMRTLLVDKCKLESSGCLGGGNDHFMAVLNTGPKTDSTETFVDFFKGPTSGFSPKMISRWAETMPEMLDLLLEIGVDFDKNDDGSWLRTVGFGQPGPWFINISNGQLIKPRLGRKIRSLGVDVLDYIMITKLLKKGNQITGALGFHVKEGTFHIIKAKAIVMALGNSANRVTTNSTGNAYNTWHSPYNTGSQYVLAYEAGCELINLDLQQKATLLPKSFGCAGMNGINSVGAHELNALGERFMGKYHPMMENGPRRNQILGTNQEIIEGKGPPIYMDMRHCDKAEVEHLQYVLMPGDKATFLDYAEQRGVDFTKYPMEVELSEIELSGMIKSDDNFASSVKGLFNGCVFYTFSGSMGSGYIAGTEAANFCIKHGSELENQFDIDELKQEKDRIFKPLKNTEGIGYERFEKAIRQVMGYYMGFVRNEEGMRIALDRLRFIETHIDDLEAANLRELMRVNEAVHLLKTCQLSTQATMERKESGRSIYQRSDYPDLKKEYGKILAIRQKDGTAQLTWI